MLARDRMTKQVITTSPSSSLDQVKSVLQKQRIQQLPVVHKGRVVGILTDRDASRVASGAETVREAMTRNPILITPDLAVDEAARLLRKHKIGSLPVVDKNRLVGILTTSDILDAFVDLSGVAEKTDRIVLRSGKCRLVETRVRQLVARCHGELKWLHRDKRKRPSEIHLRVKIRLLDDLITGLEAAGFEVVRVVST